MNQLIVHLFAKNSKTEQYVGVAECMSHYLAALYNGKCLQYYPTVAPLSSSSRHLYSYTSIDTAKAQRVVLTTWNTANVYIVCTMDVC